MPKYLHYISILFFISCQTPSNTATEKAVAQLEGYWYEHPLRILQTVLRQPDAANYRVDSLVQYMQNVHANVLVINGGGIVDYFQNQLPMANVNPFIGDRDLLAEIVAGCHQANIKVIARVDFRGVHKERYDLHPDWFAKDENGAPIILNYTTPGLYAPCYNGYYRNEHAVEFISQLFEKYNIDGIWHNSVNFHHVCYCHRCQDLYVEAYSKSIPIKADSHEEWEAFYRWNALMANNQLSKMRATVKKYGEDKSYAAEVFDMYRVEQQKHTGIDLYSAAEYFDFFVTVSFIANNSAQVEYKDIYYPSAITRFLKSLAPDKSPVILFGGNGTEHRYIYDPPVDSRLWLWETAGTGGGFWNCYFNGSFPANTLDKRNAYLASDAYEYIENNQALIQKLKPVTDVAIFYSKSTGQLLGDHEFSSAIRGCLRVLVENHFQYGFISEGNLSHDQLNQFKLLIMPNVATLSDEDTETIRTWVSEGGKLIATHKTSLYNQEGLERDDFSLSDIMGVSYDGEIVNTTMDCYQVIKERNALTTGFELTKLLHNGGSTVMVNTNTDALIVTGYLPKINNQPPENAFPENWDTQHPIAVINKYGDGEVIYFANQLALLNYTIGHPDYQDLLVNALEMLLTGAQRLSTNAPAGVHVYLNQNGNDVEIFQLSLVNTSSHSQRPFRDLVPVNDITINLPFEISSVHPLTTTDIKYKVDGRAINIRELKEFVALKIIQ